MIVSLNRLAIYNLRMQLSKFYHQHIGCADMSLFTPSLHIVCHRYVDWKSSVII
jgi:hypothetical protein